MRAAMTPRGDVRGQPPTVRDLLTRVAAALGERQVLLADPNTSPVRSRIEEIERCVTGLLAQIEATHPPEATLDDQAAVPSEFQAYLGCGGAKRRAG